MANESLDSRVTIIDYGLGNLFSLKRALEYVGANVEIAAAPGQMAGAERLVLPGVGAFGDGMRYLRSRGLVEPILAAVRSGRPLLGICLGMQLLFTESEEFGLHEGLRLIDGKVRRLRQPSVSETPVKVPHIGWSELIRPRWVSTWDSSVLEGLENGDAMYFVHSYVPDPDDPALTLGQMEYGGEIYCAVVQKDRISGVQFHPEKSGDLGLSLLQNFVSRPVVAGDKKPGKFKNAC